MNRVKPLVAALVFAAIVAASLPGEPTPWSAGWRRPIDGRIAGLRYASRGPIRSGPPTADSAPILPILNAARDDRGANAAARAAAHLALGGVDEAIAAIHQAPADPPDATGLSVLAAALLERSQRTDSIEVAAAAADAAERALRLEPAHLAALFNRGAALERLGSPDAIDAWTAYLARDGVSGWAAEAAARREAIVGRSFADGASLRERIEDRLLLDWARAEIAGTPPDRDRLLDAAAADAAQIAGRFGDVTMRDLVAEIRQARGDGIARGLLAAYEARSAIDQGLIVRAGPSLADASRLLQRLATASELLAVQEGAVAYYRADYPRARRVLSATGRAAAARGHRYVEARTRFARAAVAVRTASYSEADALYSESIRLFDESGEIASVAAAQAIFASLRHEQGDDHAAWRLLREALLRLPAIATPTHRHTVLTWATRISADRRMFALAARFARAKVEAARRWDNPVAVVSALCDLVEQEVRGGNQAAAEALIAEARAVLSRVTDAQVRPVSAAQLARSEARALSATRPCEAAPAYTQAIGTAGAVAPYQLSRLHLARALAHRACGSLDAAERDLRDGIRAFETQRVRQRDASLRISHFDEVWDLYGELVRLLAIDRAAPEAALLVADQGRARSLAEALGLDPAGDEAPEGFLARFQAGLAPDTTVVNYAVLDQEVLAWAISRDAVRFIRLPVGRERLALEVELWRAAITEGQGETDAGGRLFAILVQPVESAFRAEGLVIVVPDGPLHGLSFAALWDGAHYLVQRVRVWTAPGLRLLQRSLRVPAAARARGAAMLAIGDPAFSAARFPELPRLAFARREAAESAGFYRDRRMLIGPDATRSAILRELAWADVAHIAAHAVPNLVEPADSFFVAAAAGETDGDVVTASDVARLRRVPTTLVVLSACQTAVGRASRGEGMLSLARVFIGAGVPTVMGNLWDVADTSSYKLHVGFHQGLSGGRPAADALRAAQLRLLDSPNPDDRKPRVWAAIVGLGAPHTAIAAAAAN